VRNPTAFLERLKETAMKFINLSSDSVEGQLTLKDNSSLSHLLTLEENYKMQPWA
jgi:hypothetical protein